MAFIRKICGNGAGNEVRMGGQLCWEGIPSGPRLFYESLLPHYEKSFWAPRRNPIKCENKALVIGTIDFDGRAGEPAAPVGSPLIFGLPGGTPFSRFAFHRWGLSFRLPVSLIP